MLYTMSHVYHWYAQCLLTRGKFAAHYVGVSRAPSINQLAEPPHYNGLTLLGHPLRMEHFVGGLQNTGKRFRDLDLIRTEYDRLREHPVGLIHNNNDLILG